ncbi:MAG: helix-turn-helix domain-containing protein [Chloroflexi bacterium]|nr:helix-turn-helix domain-containing protein [Chloroflexota bacterium]
MEKLGDIQRFKERENIILAGFDPISAGGFTQVPNCLLNNFELTFAAKVVYSKLLSYAWNNNRVFPGQERMAEEIGSRKSTINKAVKELEQKGWIEIERRGQGQTNIYTLQYRINPIKK